jgi:hypothetical protein
MFIMKCDVCDRTLEIDRDNPGDSIRERAGGDWRTVEDFDGNIFDVCPQCKEKGHIPAILTMEETGYWARTTTNSLLFRSTSSSCPSFFGVNVHVVAIEVSKRNPRLAKNPESQEELNNIILGTVGSLDEKAVLTTDIDGKPHVVWVAPIEDRDS